MRVPTPIAVGSLGLGVNDEVSDIGGLKTHFTQPTRVQVVLPCGVWRWAVKQLSVFWGDEILRLRICEFGSRQKSIFEHKGIQFFLEKATQKMDFGSNSLMREATFSRGWRFQLFSNFHPEASQTAQPENFWNI